MTHRTCRDILQTNRGSVGEMPRRCRRQTAFTLVEMLVATAVTLLLVFALAQVFAVVSATVSASRATVEMSNRMRSLSHRLEQDLEGVTVPVRPWPLSSSGLGYFEYAESPGCDFDADANGTADAVQAGADTSVGDLDDVLMFTARSSGEPFVGQVLGTIQYVNGVLAWSYDPDAPTISIIRSDVAEIVWWTTWTYTDVNADGNWNSGEPIEVTLHRRALLVRPDLVIPATLQTTNAEMPDPFFFSGNDLSVRKVNGARLANSLSDLTGRGSRFAHLPLFPHLLDRTLLTPKVNVFRPGSDGQWGTNANDDGDANSNELDEAGWLGSDDTLVYGGLGNDVMSINVLAFDVKAFDPLASIVQETSGIEPLAPKDSGFGPAIATATRIGRGTYVDLGYAWTTFGQKYNLQTNTQVASAFSDRPHARSQLTVPTYDTWSWQYEGDGLDQDGDGPDGRWGRPNVDDDNNGTIDDISERGSSGSDDLVNLADEGTDGIDNDSLNGADDAGERETSPPYPEPLRGIQVQIRVLEPDSRQVRQETVVSDFIPE